MNPLVRHPSHNPQPHRHEADGYHPEGCVHGWPGTSSRSQEPRRPHSGRDLHCKLTGPLLLCHVYLTLAEHLRYQRSPQRLREPEAIQLGRDLRAFS